MSCHGLTTLRVIPGAAQRAFTRPMVAKVFTEMVLFLASYLAQKRLIFVQRVVRSVGVKPQARLDA